MNEQEYKEFMDCLIQAGYLIMKHKTENEQFVFHLTEKQQGIILRFLDKLKDSCQEAEIIVE
jgi:predicted transcriptional regulator